MKVEFVVIKNSKTGYLIMGNDYLTLHGFDITNSKDRFFTICNENKRKKFSFIPSPVKKDKTVSNLVNIMDKKPSSLTKFINSELSDASINDKLSFTQKEQISEGLFLFKDEFATADQPLGAIKGHEVHLDLTTKRPYPPFLRRPPYPAIQNNKESLDNI